MPKHDYYDIKRIIRRRRIKKAILTLATGAVVVAGIKHFNPDFKLPKFPKQNTETPVNEDDIVIFDEPVVDPGIEPYETENSNIEYTLEYYDSLNDTNATIVEHDIEDRVYTLRNAYTYYDPELVNVLPSKEELADMIDFINGDYENQSRESLETMYNKLFDYYTIILNSAPYVKRVNEHAETLVDYQDDGDTLSYTYLKPNTSTYSGEAFNCNLTDVMVTNQNIPIFPILKRLDGLHKIILSSNDVEIRDAALMEVDEILTNMCYGGEEIDGIYYPGTDFLMEDNTAAACLFEQYLYDLLPFLANISGTDYQEYGNYFTSDEYIDTWKENLIESNMDGKYSYTLK